MKDEAITSSIPEEKGADILLYSNHGLVGIQRKSIPNDFISSFIDGRMTRATSLLQQSCKFTRLICEGCFRYWPDGTVHLGMLKGGKRVPSHFTRKHIHGMLNDIEFVKGIMIRWTDDIADTVAYIRSVISFLEGDKHLGLYKRPSAAGSWGVPTAKDIDLWILQSFQGVGPAIAENIINRFGGKIPIQWTCSLEELMSVPRLSKERARTMYEALQELPPGSTAVAENARQEVIDRLRRLIGK